MRKRILGLLFTVLLIIGINYYSTLINNVDTISMNYVDEASSELFLSKEIILDEAVAISDLLYFGGRFILLDRENSQLYTLSTEQTDNLVPLIIENVNTPTSINCDSSGNLTIIDTKESKLLMVNPNFEVFEEYDLVNHKISDKLLLNHCLVGNYLYYTQMNMDVNQFGLSIINLKSQSSAKRLKDYLGNLSFINNTLYLANSFKLEEFGDELSMVSGNSQILNIDSETPQFAYKLPDILSPVNLVYWRGNYLSGCLGNQSIMGFDFNENQVYPIYKFNTEVGQLGMIACNDNGILINLPDQSKLLWLIEREK